MIEVVGKQGLPPLKDVPRPRSWPLPGLLFLVVCGLLLGMLITAIRTSVMLLPWFDKQIRAGVFLNWNVPLQFLFLGWVVLLGVAGVILMAVEQVRAGERQRTLWDLEAWGLYRRNQQSMEHMLRDEAVLAFTEVDHPDQLAPMLFERLFVLFLVVFLTAALLGVRGLLPVDPYQGFLLWITFGTTATLLACGAMLYCRPSTSLLLVLVAGLPVVHRLHWTLDPVATGPALGLPAATLPLALVALTVVAGLAAWLQRPDRELMVFTDAGLRRLRVERDGVVEVERASPPLLVLATPMAAGCRVQAGVKGREKLEPMTVSGADFLTALKSILAGRLKPCDMEGRDEPSGIAGRLAEFPLVGWVLLALLVLAAQQVLLPPLVGVLQLGTLHGAYQEELARGEVTALSRGLEEVLRQNPSLGPAALLEVRMLAGNGERQEAARRLQDYLTKRRAWEGSPAITAAYELEEELGLAAATAADTAH